MNTRRVYTDLLREFRVADNAEKRAFSHIYADTRMTDRQCRFWMIGYYARHAPSIFAAALKTRSETMAVDRLPSLHGLYWNMMLYKRSPISDDALPF